MSLAVTAIIPVLRIFDVARATEFYVGFLGFAVDWVHRTGDAGPTYRQVSLGGLTLHLSEHHGDGCPGATVFVRVSGLADYHAQVTAKGYPFMRPGLDRTERGSVEVEVIDPFGNRLRFDESAG